MIPRLNNLSNIYNVSKDFRGEITKDLVKGDARCRFSVGSEIIESSDGQINKFVLKGWINAGLEVNKGQIVEFENRTFMIDLAKTTKNLSGRDFFQYLEAREYYATN